MAIIGLIVRGRAGQVDIIIAYFPKKNLEIAHYKVGYFD
jgi:hypothetical protein